MTDPNATTSGIPFAELAQDEYAGWPLIEIYGVGPDGTCHCPRARNCKSAGKHPRGDDWQTGGQDVSTFRARSNLGVLTGEPAGFFVLDVDVPGLPAFRELLDEHGALPVTRMHRTGGGTYHFFFKQPDFDVTNRRGTLPKGIDARGTGGQVVLPPSRSAKGLYEVGSRAVIADAPDWLLDMLRPKSDEASDWAANAPAAMLAEESAKLAEVESKVDPAEAQRLLAYEKMVLDREIGRLDAMAIASKPGGVGYDGEPWDTTTFEVACTLLQMANSEWATLTREEVVDLVISHAPNDEGFTDKDVQEKLRSAARSTEGKTRNYPAARENLGGWLDAMDGDDSPARPAADQVRLHSLTDVGNARRLVDRRGDSIRWAADAEQWVVYDGKVWRHEGAETIVQRICVETIEEAGRHEAALWSDEATEFFANGQPKPSPREQFRAWIQKSLFEQRLKAMSKVARSEPGLSTMMSRFTGPRHLLNVDNCVVDLRDGSTLPHSPDLYLSQISPTAYDPAAKAPLFQAFLERVQPDAAMRDYLQMVAGYSITGETGEQAFFLHFGGGSNGKSVFLEILRAVLGGGMAQKAERETFYSKTGGGAAIPADIAAMVGARMITASETAAGRKLDDERIKEFVGGEVQRARHLYGKFFDFRPTAKIHLGTNHLPPMESGGHGMARRLRVIPWDVRIPDHEQDKTLGDRIVETEAAGVLAWMVEGAVKWYAHGLSTPQRVIDRTTVHVDDADPIWPFIRERLVVEEDVQTEFKVIVAAYVSWCEGQNVRPMSGPALSAALSERLGDDVRFKHPRTRASMFRAKLNLEAVPAPGTTIDNWMDEVS